MDPTALGRYLRESREAKELTLDDAVTALRIRRPILESFEQGDFTVVDTPVQLRGLLRNYARFLDLDEERVLQYYEAAASPRKRRGHFQRRRKRGPEPVAPRRITDTPPSLPVVQIPEPNGRRVHSPLRMRWLRMGLMGLTSVLAVGFIAFVIVDTTEIPVIGAATPEPTSTQLSEPGTETATFVPTSTLPPQTNTAVFSAQGLVGLQTRLVLVQRSWVRVVVDDTEQFRGILEPNQSLEFEANNRVQITAANAAAMRLTVNGQEQTPFGERGQQADIDITSAGVSIVLAGEVSPTPEPTLPPTEIPLPTATSTAVDVNSIGQPEVANAQEQATIPPTTALPTPTSIFDDPPSPTPEQPTPTSLYEPASTDNSSQAAVVDTAAQAAPETTAPTATPVPATAAGVVLPLRATPDNPTPTKTG